MSPRFLGRWYVACNRIAISSARWFVSNCRCWGVDTVFRLSRAQLRVVLGELLNMVMGVSSAVELGQRSRLQEADLSIPRFARQQTDQPVLWLGKLPLLDEGLKVLERVGTQGM